jgi:hypothetical protein
MHSHHHHHHGQKRVYVGILLKFGREQKKLDVKKKKPFTLLGLVPLLDVLGRVTVQGPRKQVVPIILPYNN